MASYFWVGGTGTWDGSTTTNWASTTGGAGGAGVPNSTDTVNFDANSGAGTCTTASGSACAGLTFNTSTVNLVFGANHTQNNVFNFTLGSIDLNNNVLTCLALLGTNSNVRSIAFGTGKIVLTGNNALILEISNAANFTYTGTPTIEASYSGAVGTRTLRFGRSGGATEANAIDLKITGGTDALTLTNNNVFGNLDFTGFAGTLANQTENIYRNLTISSGMTVTGGTAGINFLATSGTQQITTNGKTLDFPITQNGVGGTVQLQDNLTMGSTRTYTLTNGALDLSSGNRTLSTGLFSSSGSTTRSIAFGTGNITLTGNGATIWSCATATNLSYTGTPTVNLTYAGATGTRGISHGSVAGATEANSLNFNVSAGTDTLSVTSAAGSSVKNLNFTGFAGTFPATIRVIYGNLTLVSGMTLTAGNGTTTFAGTSGTQQITTAGLTLDYPIAFNGIGGTFAFQDAVTQASTRAFTITNGTVQLKNGVTSTVGVFATSGTNQKFLQSTTPGLQATLSQASGTVDATRLTIRDINAVGGATWNAFVNQQNIDAGNNDGWDFGISPIVGSYEYTYQLRSFTQPRRF